VGACIPRHVQQLGTRVVSGLLPLDKSARREGTSGTTPRPARHITVPFSLPSRGYCSLAKLLGAEHLEARQFYYSPASSSKRERMTIATFGLAGIASLFLGGLLLAVLLAAAVV